MKKRVIIILACILVAINSFAFSACNNIEGTFYSLEEAYEMGLLTKDDLLSIAYYHNDGRTYNEEIMPEDYKPLTKNPGALSKETELKIKQSFWNENYASGRLDNCTIDSLGVEYFGTYNDCSAVMVWCSDWGYGFAEYEEKIAGICISYSCENFVKIWTRGE